MEIIYEKRQREIRQTWTYKCMSTWNRKYKNPDVQKRVQPVWLECAQWSVAREVREVGKV